MPMLPPMFQKYVVNNILVDLHPVYAVLNFDGRVVESGGDLGKFGIQRLVPGQMVSDTLLFMEGLLPLDKPVVRLPGIKLQPKISVDVHVFQSATGYGLLMLDVSRQERDHSRLQQKANDLALLREKHARLIDQHIGIRLTENLLGLNLKHPENVKRITVLFADIRGFNRWAQQMTPADALHHLNAQLTALIQPVQEEGGVVENIIGGAVMAVFGLLPSHLPAAVQALNAAEKMMLTYQKTVQPDSRPELPVLGTGIGVASGEAIIGILGIQGRPTLSVIGDCLKSASRLEKHARPGQIIIDPSTYSAAEDVAGDFTAVQLDPKNMKHLEKAYLKESAQ